MSDETTHIDAALAKLRLQDLEAHFWLRFRMQSPWARQFGIEPVSRDLMTKPISSNPGAISERMRQPTYHTVRAVDIWLEPTPGYVILKEPELMHHLDPADITPIEVVKTEPLHGGRTWGMRARTDVHEKLPYADSLELWCGPLEERAECVFRAVRTGDRQDVIGYSGPYSYRLKMIAKPEDSIWSAAIERMMARSIGRAVDAKIMGSICPGS